MKYAVHQVFVHDIRQCDLKPGLCCHGFGDGINRFFVPGPGSPGDTVVHIPVQHGMQAAVCFFRAVEQESEAAVDHLALAHTATVMNRHPGGAPETVADHILDGHIGGEF